jgi:hypothetical protein
MGELKDPSLARLQRGLPRQRKENAENYESDDLDMHAFAPTLVDGLTAADQSSYPWLQNTRTGGLRPTGFIIVLCFQTLICWSVNCFRSVQGG